MYRFMKSSQQSSGSSSSRLFVQGTREGGDRDDVALHAAHAAPAMSVVQHRDHQLVEHHSNGANGGPPDLHAVHTQVVRVLSIPAAEQDDREQGGTPARQGLGGALWAWSRPPRRIRSAGGGGVGQEGEGHCLQRDVTWEVIDMVARDRRRLEAVVIDFEAHAG